MKKRLLLLFSIISILLLCSCVPKFNLFDRFKPTPTVAQVQAVAAGDVGESLQTQSETGVPSNETNYDSSPAVVLPDLVPSMIVYEMESLLVGQEIYFDSAIRNDGKVDSEGFNIKWFVNEAQMGYGGHPGVASGVLDLSSNSQFSWTPPAAGQYKIEFVVDSDDFIKELDETNNSVSAIVSIP